MKSKNYLFQAIGLALLLGLFSCKNNNPEGQPAEGESVTTQASTPAIEDLTKKIEGTPNSAELYASRGEIVVRARKSRPGHRRHGKGHPTGLHQA